MISLYIRIVYKAWIIRSREEYQFSSEIWLSAWYSNVHSTLIVIPGARVRSEVWKEIWDVANDIAYHNMTR